MPSPSRTTMVPARLEKLRALRAFLEHFCTDFGIEQDPKLRLNVVLEELFTNTVRHGHGGDCEAPVWVTLARPSPRSLALTYEDSARPFNPYTRLPDKSPDTTAELRKLGGLGVLLTRKLAASRDYAYLYGRNRIRVAFSLD